MFLVLPEALQNRIDILEAFVNIASGLGPSKNDLAVHKDEQNHPGLDHSIDETRKEFRFIGTELLMHLV